MGYDKKVADLAIIGAGPAGSNAAAVALLGGLSVVQIDKAVFPRRKACAGGLSGKSLRSLQFDLQPVLRAKSAVIECNIWDDEMNRFLHKQVLVSMVVRPEFDNYLVRQNQRNPGFTFLDGEPVKSISHDGQRFSVVTTRRVVTARQLVGADGANGIVNKVFQVCKPHLAYALEVNPTRQQATIRTEIHPCIDLCFIKQGYGWVFPKDDQWSIGLYTLATGIPKLKLLLVEYMKAKGFVVQGDPLATFEAHPIPIGGYRLNVPAMPVYVVGDAGGFADAILGEGIYYALESGRLAGLTAVETANGQADHHEYYAALRRKILPDTFLTYVLAKRLVYKENPGGPFWRLSKRVLQRLIVQEFSGRSDFMQAILRAGSYFPKSFWESRFEVESL